MDNLSKSLAALDAAAEEMLKKSKDADDVEPDDVSDTDDDDDDTVEKCDTPDGDSADTVQKSDDCDGDDCDVQKSDDTDDDEDEDDSDESLEDVQKSIEDDFQSDVDIIKGIENSEFQAAMIATLVKSLGEIQYDINQNKRAANNTTSVLAKSLQATLAVNQKLLADNERLVRRMNKLEKSFTQGLERIMDSIDDISIEPAHVRKSVNSISVYDKDFQAGFVLEFQKDEFIIRTITNNGLVWERYAYRKDDDTYYAKSIQSFNGISWDDTQGDEEVLPLEYIGDFITLDGDTYNIFAGGARRRDNRSDYRRERFLQHTCRNAAGHDIQAARQGHTEAAA